MSADQPLTGDELAGIPSEVAQALIDHAARVKDAGARSALLAASRIVDSVILENLRLVAEIERKDAALAFKQGIIDDLSATVERLEQQASE